MEECHSSESANAGTNKTLKGTSKVSLHPFLSFKMIICCLCLAMYVKQVMKQNDKLQAIVDLDPLELLANREDAWPCLNLRKALQRIRIKINMTALTIIKHKSFEASTILIIVANCITLTMSKADQEPTETETAIENVFQGLYTVEMILKILGMGLVFNQGAYLRDYFNILDFFIVMSAYLSMMQTDGSDSGLSLSSLRAFRVLKPLRAVNNIPGLRLIVQSILSALPLLSDTIIVLLFFFLIFAIGGVNLFSGELRQRCIFIDDGSVLLDDEGEEVICGVNQLCGEGYFCGKRILNPNYDVTSFDNIFWAMLVIFQCVTLEGWSDIMVLYQKVYTYYVFLFFVPLVFIGAFFLLNLTLAVINYSFNEAQERMKEQKASQVARVKEMIDKNSEGIKDPAKRVKDQNKLSSGKELKDMGISEFFTAKRAAKRLTDFATRFHQQKLLARQQQLMFAEKDTDRQEVTPRTPNSQRTLRETLRDPQKQTLDPAEKTGSGQVSHSFSRSPNKGSNQVQPMTFTSESQVAAKQEKFQLATSAISLQKKAAQIQKIRRQQTINVEQLDAKSPISRGTPPSSTPVSPMVNSDKLAGSPMAQQFPEQQDVETITEEDQTDEKLSHPSVQEFLQKLQDMEQADESMAHMGESDFQFEESMSRMKPLDTLENTKNMSFSRNNMHSKSSANMIMAFNDLRRAKADIIKTTDLIRPEDYVLGTKAINDGALKRIRTTLIEKERWKAQSIGRRINNELDADRLLVQRRKLATDEVEGSTKVKDSRKPDSTTQIHYFNENDHEYDLSFILKSRSNSRDIGAALSEMDPEERKTKSLLNSPAKANSLNLSDSATSVILSDSSIASAVQRFSKAKKKQDRDIKKFVRQSTIRGDLKKDMNQNLQRRLTTEINAQSPLRMHEKELSEDRTTNFGAQSVKQQIDCYSSLNAMVPDKIYEKQSYIEKNKAEILAQQKSEKIHASAKAKQIQAQFYADLDVNDFNLYQSDPYSLLDRKKQKIVLNQDVDYDSTSFNDIFELRHKRQQNEFQEEANFIKIHETEVEIQIRREKEPMRTIDEDDYGDTFIRASYLPWQMKSKFQLQKSDDIILDDDDEDALVLQQQPFETVMSISQSSLLNHLNTKFITRRSDIIVSSTMSFTLTPMETFKPARFYNFTEDDVDEWVELRSEYRASLIKQCELGMASVPDDSSDMDQPEQTSISALNNTSSIEPSYTDQSQLSSKGNQIRKPVLKLPDCLLSEPLPPDQIMLLSEQEKRDYNNQKSRYEGEQRKLQKQNDSAREKEYNLKDARLLVTGMFWEDEEEEQDRRQKRVLEEKSTNRMNSNLDRTRSVFLGRKTLQDDIRLEAFEQEIRQVISNEDHEDSLEKHLTASLIPDAIRKEFNLPDDMTNLDLDFNQVRLNDATIAIKRRVWSGQEILATSVNSEQAGWIAKKISAVRVWPKEKKQNLFKKFQSLLKIHCMNPFFEHFMTFCVMLNTMVMSMDRYGLDQDYERVLMQMNELFTWIFIYEMAVKLLAIGPKKYTASKWNLLDGGVVLLSIMELIMESQQSNGSEGGSSVSAFRSVKVFRTFRVMRIARILRALHSMQVIIGVITRSFRSFFYVVVLLFLFVFIYALLGIQIFQGKYNFGPNEELPRGNFEDFGIAFVTVFQVLTMENWQDVMFASMRSARGSSVLKAITAIYYISWIFIGNFILLNLFLAILIDSFNSEQSETTANIEELDEAERKSQAIQQQKLQNLKIKRMKKLGSYTRGKAKHLRGKSLNQNQKNLITFTGKKQSKELEIIDDLDDLGTDKIQEMLIKNKIIKDSEAKEKKVKIPQEIECTKSIYLFHRDGWFRKVCYFIQQHKYFDNFIMFLITASSLQLALETYIQGLPKDAPAMIVNSIVGQIFTYLFLLELLFKLVALGLVMENGSYLRESWNILDFFIVMTSIVDRAMSSSDIAALKILRMLRILRPLRVVSHNVQLKMIVIALLDAGGSILNVIIVVLVVWLMFAIFAVNNYKGHFFYCSIEKYDYSDKYECESKGGEWLRYDSNFDDVGQAMMTLFVVSSLEGWPTIMNQAMDITKVDRGPQYQGNIKQAIFFIVFILIGSFFFLNFFIGVLFLKYSEAQKREVAGFTEDQLKWMEMQAMILNAKVPHNNLNKPTVRRKWRLKAYNLVTSSQFEGFIIIVIVLNMLQMAFTFEGSSKSFDKFMDTTNLIFTAVFIVEAILKLFAFRWSYFGPSWNKFDFFVVIASIFDIFMTIQQESQESDEGGQARQQSALSVAPQLARVLRVLRVSRVLRIAGHYKGLQSLFNTILYSVSALINVFMLLMLFFFILATLGQFMFNGVKSGLAINEYKNFTVFDRSFLLLFSISTGEDWNRIMYDCSWTAPDCIEGETCGSEYAAVYFISFILLVTYVMLNLFILVIIQQFEKLYLNQEGPLQLFERDYAIIVAVWIKFTSTNRCRKLKQNYLQDFLKAIPAPLGLSDQNEVMLKKSVLKMGFKAEDGWIYFNELLYRILRNQHGQLRLNGKMQIRELITQFKLFNLTMSTIKKNKQSDIQERFFKKVGNGGADTFNPFLTQMYYRISFLTWANLMRRRVRQQDIVKGKEINQFETSNSNLEETTQYHAIEIDVENYSEYTVSSNDEEHYSKANLMNSMKKRQSFKNVNNFHNTGMTYSAKEQRQIVKKRMSRRKAFVEDQNSKTMLLAHSQKLLDIASAESLGQNKISKYLSPATNSMISKLYSTQQLGSPRYLRQSNVASSQHNSRSKLATSPGLKSGIIKRILTHAEGKNKVSLLQIQNINTQSAEQFAENSSRIRESLSKGIESPSAIKESNIESEK